MTRGPRHPPCNPIRELDARLQRLRQELAPVEAAIIAELREVSYRLEIRRLFERYASHINKAFDEACDPTNHVTTFE